VSYTQRTHTLLASSIEVSIFQNSLSHGICFGRKRFEVESSRDINTGEDREGWADMSEVTLMLDAVASGKKQASEDLMPLVYKELRRLAAARMAHEAVGQTLQPTALVHEAWLQLVGRGNQSWQNRAHFFAAASIAMRRILIDNARRKARLRHGGGRVRMYMQRLNLAEAMPNDSVLLIDEALDQLEKDDPQQAHVVLLKFFGGLTNLEVAETLGVSERTVDRQWACARARLFRWINETLGN
jgi:RNA polymerase sigma factor (TIGR02999 family)